jgi:hypothetical protein
MVITLELPIRHKQQAAHHDYWAAYEARFGAPPCWLDEIAAIEIPALLRLALRRGAPLAPADLS